MNRQEFLIQIARIHELFSENEKHLNTLSDGINSEGPQREILDTLLDTLRLPKNAESRYAAAARIGDKKFEPLEIYLEKL